MTICHLRSIFYRLLLLVCMSSVAASVSADQNAAELPGLFAELQQAVSQAEVTRLEGLIWQHWLEPPDEQAGELMAQITLAMAGADMELALPLSSELVDAYPDYAEAWNKRATLHYILGNNAASVADIRETIALEPRHFGAISGLGLIFLRDENLPAALQAFEQVLAISPASESAKRTVARLRDDLEREI